MSEILKPRKISLADNLQEDISRNKLQGMIFSTIRQRGISQNELPNAEVLEKITNDVLSCDVSGWFAHKTSDVSDATLIDFAIYTALKQWDEARKK